MRPRSTWTSSGQSSKQQRVLCLSSGVCSHRVHRDQREAVLQQNQRHQRRRQQRRKLPSVAADASGGLRQTRPTASHPGQLAVGRIYGSTYADSTGAALIAAAQRAAYRDASRPDNYVDLGGDTRGRSQPRRDYRPPRRDNPPRRGTTPVRGSTPARSVTPTRGSTPARNAPTRAPTRATTPARAATPSSHKPLTPNP